MDNEYYGRLQEFRGFWAHIRCQRLRMMVLHTRPALDDDKTKTRHVVSARVAHLKTRNDKQGIVDGRLHTTDELCGFGAVENPTCIAACSDAIHSDHPAALHFLPLPIFFLPPPDVETTGAAGFPSTFRSSFTTPPWVSPPFLAFFFPFGGR